MLVNQKHTGTQVWQHKLKGDPATPRNDGQPMVTFKNERQRRGFSILVLVRKATILLQNACVSLKQIKTLSNLTFCNVFILLSKYSNKGLKSFEFLFYSITIPRALRGKWKKKIQSNIIQQHESRHWLMVEQDFKLYHKAIGSFTA